MGHVREPGTVGPLHLRCMRALAGAPSSPDIRPRAVRGSIALTASILALGGFLQALPAQAIEFGEGEFQGSLDTTLSHGVTFRVGERDDRLAAKVNNNDGNLNYDRGLVSNTSKFTSDLDLGVGNFGAFARVTGFLDFENENGARERTPLSEEAKNQVGRDLEVLDLYVTGAFELGDANADLRVGKHVLNWGESTFIQNGINAINPFDVGQLRLPGSELREALVPVPLVSASVAPTDTLSVEGFYQLRWKETEIDPVGTYFSTIDYVGAGARRAVIPVSDSVTDRGFGFGPLTPAINADLAGFALPQPTQPDFDPDFLNVTRGPDRTPDHSGQWGGALRYLAEGLNDTEFGLYFVNHHSRLPLVSARTGEVDGIQAGFFAAQAVSAPGSRTVAAVTQAVTAEVQSAVQAGSIDPAAAPAIIEAQVSEKVREVAQALALDRYGETGHYFIEYPENIRLFGLSFNTLLGASGWALQGEYSFRRDAPLQKAERVVFREGLAPILRILDTKHPDYVAPADIPAYLATYQPTIVQGYVERDVSQIQATATKVLGPTFGADSMVFVTEVALMHVHDMPDTPLESPAGGRLATPDADADATSWGYRLAARLDYNNAVGGANLFPYLQFGHDVNGNSPTPSGSFVEGRTALTLGLSADYLSRWQANVGYTWYAGKGNELSDRDFISASVKYSF